MNEIWIAEFLDNMSKNNNKKGQSGLRLATWDQSAVTHWGGHACLPQGWWFEGVLEGQKESGSSRMLPSARRCLHNTRLFWTPPPQLWEHCRDHDTDMPEVSYTGYLTSTAGLAVYSVMHLQYEIHYLSPVTRFPHRRAVKAVAGLNRTGLGVLTVPVPQNFSVVAVSERPMSARHGACHQTNPTGSGAWTPLPLFPPVKSHSSKRVSNDAPMSLRGGAVLSVSKFNKIMFMKVKWKEKAKCVQRPTACKDIWESPVVFLMTYVDLYCVVALGSSTQHQS